MKVPKLDKEIPDQEVSPVAGVTSLRSHPLAADNWFEGKISESSPPDAADKIVVL